MLSVVSCAAMALLAAQSAEALKPPNFSDATVKPKMTVNGVANNNTVKEYRFSVPVDHFHDKPLYEPHSKDFYPLRYFLEPSYYKPGGPVIVIASGETSAQGRVPYLNNGIGSVLAKATGGMVITLEHRYYGKSAPVPTADLTVESYRFLTTEQAMADAAYFAQHVQFPGFEHYNLTAPNTPWIMYGGSYAGAFAAFTRKVYPETYWGAISSSGTTAAINDFWEYNEAARLFAPGDCGTVMGKLTHVVDTALLSGNETKVDTIKQFFRYFGTIGIADFGHTIAHPLYALQGESWVKGLSDVSLNKYCATLTSNTLQYPELEKNRAVAEQLVQDAGYCPDAATRLLNYAGLQDPSAPPFKRRMASNSCNAESEKDCAVATAKKMKKRDDDDYEFDEYTSFNYQKCTQWGYFVSGDGVPKSTLGILSRAVTMQYANSTCELTFNITTPPDTDAINRFGGLNFSYPRVAVIDGKQDPWRAATAHKIGINEDRKSTASEPFILIDYATHHWDEDDVPQSEYEPGYPPEQIIDVHNKEVALVKAWLKEYTDTRAMA